jgi:HAE1 family hydrophobic/amphiphilic exporter-1
MLLVQASLKNRTAVVVVCLLVLLFGAIALRRIPIQLTPTVERPVITIETLYPGAAPMEVEQQITVPMEEQLNAVENLRRLTSSSQENMSRISLEFDWGVNTDLAVTDIRDRLDLVDDLPDDSERPQISTGGGSRGSVVFWAVGRETSDVLALNDLRKVADDLIVPRLRRVEGVADVLRFGGQEREIQVVLDLEALRARGLTIAQVRSAIRSENRNVRGGDLETGRTRYIVRTVGQFSSVDELANMLITRGGEGEVRLRDVAEVIDGHEDNDFEVRFNGEPAIAFGMVRKTGANAITVVRGIREAIDELNTQIESRGINVRPAYDETEYIWDSIRMVVISMLIGAAMATVMLYIFLRSLSSTMIIATIIPVALLGSIILLWATGRTINIVSLAGLAFASGMVVDNAIVVLENIYTKRQRGLGHGVAADRGTVEVWGAILASTLTTLAVFTPIVLIKEESGQLFADIALAISFAVASSLALALYVIPAASSKFLHIARGEGRLSLAFIGSGFARGYRSVLGVILRSATVRVGVIGLLVAIFAVSTLIIPPAEYLPNGNRNLMFTFIRMPPGLTLGETDRLMSQIERRFLSHPSRDRMFAVARRGAPIMGFIVRKEEADRENMQRVLGELRDMAQGLPGAFAFVSQAGLFQRGFSGGKSVTVDISGPDLRELIRISQEVERAIGNIDGVERTDSSFQAGNPELQVEIDAERAAELGLTISDVAAVVETAVGGVDVSLFREGGDDYDIVLKSDESILENPDSLREVRVTAPSGRTLPLSAVARVIETHGPTEIQHIEMDRSITLTVNFGQDVALQTVIETIERDVAEPLRARLPPAYGITFSGSADDLARTARVLAPTIALAIVITYLLLAALFQSFLYPIVIILSVPLAWTGGFLGLTLMSGQAEFNVITMFGFVILIGIVVNNAILIIAQTLNHMRLEGRSPRKAIEEACMDRLRPIFMSTLTSILGMLPLALGTGNGSELYRGLGIVVVGGLALSTLFTLLLVPAVFIFFIRVREILFGTEVEGEPATVAG